VKVSWIVRLVSAAIAVLIVAGFLSIALVGLSVSQLKVNVGGPETEATGAAVTLRLPVNLSNDGPLAVRSLSLDANVRDGNETLAHVVAGPIDVPPGSVRQVPLTVVFDFEAVKPETLRTLASSDRNLTIGIKGDLVLDPLLSLGLSAQAFLRWGAPLSGLSVGQPAIMPYNLTHLLASVPVSFVNNSTFIDLSGRVRVAVYDEANSLRGVGELNVTAPKGSRYRGSLDLPMMIPAGIDQMLLNDTVLNYRADVAVSINNFGRALNFSQPIEVDWGAPLRDLKIGSPAVQPFNLTDVAVTVPYNFTNNSPSSLNASIKTGFYSSTGTLIGSSGWTEISVPAGNFFQGSIRTLLKASDIIAGGVKARLTIETAYGTFTKEMDLVA
jgi:hypothetical protein